METLRIGIDGYNLAMRRGTGIATYGFSLAGALARAGHRVDGVFGIDTGRDAALREVMFFDLLSREPQANKTRKQVRVEARRLFLDAVRPALKLTADDVPLSDRVEKSGFAQRLPVFDRLVSVPRLFEIAHRHFGLYKRFVRVRMPDPPQIMHWTYPVPVELEGARNIYTLHDLVPLKLPYTTLDSKADYAGIVRHCAADAAHICTVSDASRADIIEQLGIAPDRVTNTYQTSPMPASARALSAEEDAHMIEGVFGLPPQGFFLYYGAIEPKKNIGRLIEAHLSIRTETPLVIVGARAWQSEDELHLLAGGGEAARRVIRLEYLPRALLLRLIRSARAVVFPSLYEGFGLPVLEAMQLGTPVLTSRTSSLPEIAGDAAVYVDPYDVASIAGGLRQLDGDEALRHRLSAAGLKRAALFSEATYIDRLDRLYRHVLADDPIAARSAA